MLFFHCETHPVDSHLIVSIQNGCFKLQSGDKGKGKEFLFREISASPPDSSRSCSADCFPLKDEESSFMIETRASFYWRSSFVCRVWNARGFSPFLLYVCSPWSSQQCFQPWKVTFETLRTPTRRNLINLSTAPSSPLVHFLASHHLNQE